MLGTCLVSITSITELVSYYPCMRSDCSGWSTHPIPNSRFWNQRSGYRQEHRDVGVLVAAREKELNRARLFVRVGTGPGMPSNASMPPCPKRWRAHTRVLGFRRPWHNASFNNNSDFWNLNQLSPVYYYNRGRYTMAADVHSEVSLSALVTTVVVA